MGCIASSCISYAFPLIIPYCSIFRAGDLGLEMYIIRKGQVAVVGTYNQMMSLLCEGEHFGEIALFTQVTHCLTQVAQVALVTASLRTLAIQWSSSCQLPSPPLS